MNVTINGRSRHFRTVTFDQEANSVRLIEQRLLPHKFRVIGTRDFRETAAAIRDMVVRGAGAIGATAAYGLAQGARAFRGRNLQQFAATVKEVYRFIHHINQCLAKKSDQRVIESSKTAVRFAFVCRGDWI